MYGESVRGWLEKAGESVCLRFFERSNLEAIFHTGRLLSRVNFWKFLQRELKPTPQDLVFFLYWDDVKPFWLPERSRAFVFPSALVGIWMNTWGFRREGVLRISSGVLRKYAFLKEPGLGLLILDEGVLRDLRPRVRARLGFLPDFCDMAVPQASHLVEEVAEFRGRQRLCLMIGAILGNKSVEIFLEVARRTAHEGWVFAIVGEVLVDGLEGKAEGLAHVKIWNGRVGTESEYNALLMEADLLWGVYQKWEGSSNLLTKAGLHGIPVVVARGYLAEARVRQYDLGYVVDDHDPQDLVELLSSWGRESKAGPVSRQFLEDFSAARAEEAVLSLVAHGATPPRRRGWGALELLWLSWGQGALDGVKFLLGRGKPE